MTRALAQALGASLLVAAAAAVATGTTALPATVQNTLTTIDSVPTKSQIDSVFPSGQALTNLVTIAQDFSADKGVRLRAIHALAKYCPNPCADTEVAHQTLVSLIADYRQQIAGYDLLVLRASIETIGTLEVATDVDTLVPLLDHPSRDIRAATARALRDLCNPDAIQPLRVRHTAENTEQVKLAISEAIRILGQCAATP
jgi:HEAT repeat protein